ncbi:MAG: hypothetical protein WDW38_010438 [Sanguina aurantia]
MNDRSLPLRVALVGYGYAGKTFHAPLIGATEALDIVIVASGDAAKVHADLPDVDVVGDAIAAINDPRVDLVVIATPNATHAPLARAALAAGKHVVVDKPFALDLAEARDLAQLAATGRNTLSIFHNRRWDSDFLGVKDAIERGLVGEVAHFESHFDRYRPAPRDRWRERPDAGGGLWYDLGPHLIDQALLLFGLPDRVQGNLAIQRKGGQATDWAHVLLHYGSRRVVLHASMLPGETARRSTEAQLLAGMRPGDPGWGIDPDETLFHDADGHATPVATPAGDQRTYYARLRDAIRGDGDNPVTPLQAVTVMAVLEAAIASSVQAAAVDLALSDAERRAWS